MTDWPETKKYDDVDFHIDAAVEAGQPEENAFAHIGLYLGWLISRDLVDPTFFVQEHLAAVKAGELTGSALASAADGKLVSDMLSAEGAAFTDWYYERYLEDYEQAFADRGEYAVADDAGSRQAIEPLIDDRYSDWVQGERPRGADPLIPPTLAGLPNVGVSVRIAMDGLDELDQERRAYVEEFLADAKSRGWAVLDAPPPPHETPELETLFPADLGDPPLEISSTSAQHWRSSMLNRVLKDLGVRPRDAMVAIAMAGRGERNVTAGITSIPGIDRARLSEIVPRLEKPLGGTGEMRVIGGKDVVWWTTDEFIKASWAADGLVMIVAGRDIGLVESAIAKLP